MNKKTNRTKKMNNDTYNDMEGMLRIVERCLRDIEDDPERAVEYKSLVEEFIVLFRSLMAEEQAEIEERLSLLEKKAKKIFAKNFLTVNK